MASSTNGDITGVLASLTEEELALLALLTKEELASLTEEQLKSFFESVPSQPKIGKSIPLPEAISSFYKDEKERYDLLSYISGYLSFVSISDIIMTMVAGDGKCFLYAFIAHLKCIGTFSLPLGDLGFEDGALDDPMKKEQYLRIQNQTVEEKCAELRDASVDFYNETVIRIFTYLPIVNNDTGVCSPHILLYLSRIYSTIIVIIHYEDTVGEPTIVNGVLDGTAFEDICFILCKGGHCYGMYVPNKGIRKDIYFDIIGNFNYQCIKFDS